MPIDWNTLTIMGTIAGTAFLGGMWLSKKFDDISNSFRVALAEHEKADNQRFESIGFRLLKVELEIDKEGRHVAPAERSRYEI